MVENSKDKKPGAPPEKTGSGAQSPGISNIQTASAAGSAAPPADKAGVKSPAYLYRFEHAVIEGGKTKKKVWLETEAAGEKQAWAQIPAIKLKHGIPDAQYTGLFEIHKLK